MMRSFFNVKKTACVIRHGLSFVCLILFQEFRTLFED